MATQELLDKTTESLERIQNFDPATLGQKDRLGPLNFDDAVPAASVAVSLFQRINPQSLPFFSDGQLQQIQSHTNSTFSIFDSITKFDPEKSGNAFGDRNSLISQITALPEQLMGQLWQHVAYAVATTLDPTAIQQQMRSSMQAFSDERSEALKEVKALQAQSEEVLSRIRDAAAEQGVSQQAQHFKAIADKHNTEADEWLRYSIYSGAATLGFAILTAVLYRVPWIAPRDGVEAAQLIASKVLIIAILSYASFICVRNFLSHKHNKVVNEHRQNSLLTYTAFVDAAPSLASREIVLTHAAASVFTPQETGYIKQEEPAGGRSVLEMITKASVTEPKA